MIFKRESESETSNIITQEVSEKCIVSGFKVLVGVGVGKVVMEFIFPEMVFL